MSFAKTFHHLSLHPPSLILVTNTALPTPDQPSGSFSRRLSGGGGESKAGKKTLLVESLEDSYNEIEVVPINRKYWNDDAG